MEWTKENTDKTYIVCKSAVAYKKALNFYESIGHKITYNIARDISDRKNKIFYYVAAFASYVTICSFETGLIHESKEINPFYKPRRKFPRTMLVSDDNKKWERRVVVGKIKSNAPYVVSINGKALEEGQVFKFLLAFKYAKEEITK